VDISANSSKTSNSSYLEMTSSSNSTATDTESDFPVDYIIGIVVGVFVLLCICFFVCAFAKFRPCTFCAPRCCCLSCDCCSKTPTETIPGLSEERRQEDGCGSSNCGGSGGCCNGSGDRCRRSGDCSDIVCSDNACYGYCRFLSVLLQLLFR